MHVKSHLEGESCDCTILYKHLLETRELRNMESDHDKPINNKEEKKKKDKEEENRYEYCNCICGDLPLEFDFFDELIFAIY